MKILLRENESPVEARAWADIDRAITSATEEARAEGRLIIIELEAVNGNSISVVVGGDETVLGFVYRHRNPPYYASKGSTEDDEPVMTAYFLLAHHTEFPRNWVIPLKEVMSAVNEFCQSGELPKCIEWVEV